MAGAGFLSIMHCGISSLLRRTACRISPKRIRGPFPTSERTAICSDRSRRNRPSRRMPFVDPIADVAVLTCPNNQSLFDDAEAYEQFVEARPVLRIGTLSQTARAWLLTLDGDWEQRTVRPGFDRRSLTLVDAKSGNVPGTSGSPILLGAGRAVGVISVGSESHNTRETTTIIDCEQARQPSLARDLPRWLVDELLTRKRQVTP
jgi:hypothetical protein